MKTTKEKIQIAYKKRGKKGEGRRRGGRQPSRKRIQNNDSEDDPGPWKKNGGKD